MSHKIKEDRNVTNINVSNQTTVFENLNLHDGSTIVTAHEIVERTLVGWTNTDTFSASAAVTAFNTLPGYTAAAGTPVRLPTGAYITQAVIISTVAITTAGNPTMDIGTGGSTATTTSAGCFDGVDVDNVTPGTGLGLKGNHLINLQPVAGTSFVTEPAEDAATGSDEKRVSANNFVTIEIKTAPVTGQLKIIIKYKLIV